jgi:tRNA U34 5-methylaminomethyl-2-thiouridine-forming methyltransferase MnmC
LEIGFGTGLNAFLTLKEAENSNLIQHIDYFSIELYPLEKSVTDCLNYEELSGSKERSCFQSLHTAEWSKAVDITTCFTLHKIWGNAIECAFPDEIDIVFFDAFAPEKQPEMWGQAVFNKLYAALVEQGVIVTYCAKGEVRRKMQAAGFQMQRLPGPPGKRHMLFGQKMCI